MKNINRLMSQMMDLQKSVNDPKQKELIGSIIKILKGEDNAPPISALTRLLKKLHNKPIVYKVVDLICRFIFSLAEHEVCVKTIKMIKALLKY